MRTTGALDIQKKKSQPQKDIFFNRKIVAPQKLKILVLSGNDIISDELQFIHKCINLIKLDLSYNNITKVSTKLGMERLTKLEILYLHNNKIENAVGLEGVFTVPKLTHLTIKDNPVEKLPRIQHLIVNVLPTLKVIGNRVVFVQERSPDCFQVRNKVFIENYLIEGWKLADNSEAQYIRILQLQLKYFNNVWFFNNPIILIQRAWRAKLKYMHSVQKQYKITNRRKQLASSQPLKVIQKSQQLNFLRGYLKQWKKFSQNRKVVKKELSQTYTQYPQNKIHLTYPLKQYNIALRNLRTQKVVKAYVKKIRQKIYVRKMAERIYEKLKQKKLQFNSGISFFWLCGIGQTKMFYFNKIQYHILQNFLIHISQRYNWKDKITKSIKRGSVTHYLSIRTVDPQTFSYKKANSVLTYSLWPSMKAIFLKKKKFQSKQKTGLIKIKPLIYIKNKYKVLTKQQYKKSCKVYKQLQKFHKKQYENSLDYFYCEDQQVMKMLLRYTYYHNTKIFKFEKKTIKNEMQSLLESYDQPFIIYVQNILQRTAAAVRIQQNWRKYLTNKRAKQSIYNKMKKTRALLRIQRFWRDHVFYHRLSFQKSIACQLKLFNTNSFLIPQQTYIHFQGLCRAAFDNQLYTGLKLIKGQNKLRVQWEFQKPVYFPHTCKNFFQYDQHSHNSFKKSGQQQQIWNILHFRSTVNKVKIADKEFYQFKFQSPQQARFRIFLMALFSYRCKNSIYFLPLSRDTLDLLNFRFQQYDKLRLLNNTQTRAIQKVFKSKKSLKIKQNQVLNTIKNISILRNYQQQGTFLFSQKYNIKKYPQCSITLQFYQKVFKDFPKKYVCELSYYLNDEIQNQKKQQKQKQFQKLMDQVKISPLSISQIKSEIEEKSKNEQNFMNVTKIDKKRLSFYDVGGKTSNVRKKQDKEKPKTSGDFYFHQVVDKRQNISRIKMENNSKKQQIDQKKKSNLKKIRQDLQREKSLNMTSKNIKQIQRSQQLRKKVERVKQMKNRVSSLRKQDNHEQDFIQQGNFVMQQQLKMLIMRSKMQSFQPKKKQKSEILSHKNSQTYQKSFYTEQKRNQIKVFQNSQNLKPISQSLGATLLARNQEQNVIEGQERKIINIRNQRRSKSRSIGAYLRDPSLVHGVFPQQYYPIDTKQTSNFKFFPPVL